MPTMGELRRRGVLYFSDGYRTKASELAPAGYRILRAGDVREGRTIFESADFVDSRMASAIGSKFVQPHDVVLTTKGTVGRTAYVDRVPSPSVYSPQLCFFRADASVLFPKFLYYWFSGLHFRHQSASLMSSTDMAPYLSLIQLDGVDIQLPPIREQQAIAEVLGALDDKIAANDAVADCADRLVRAIYENMPIAGMRLGDICVNPRSNSLPGEGEVVYVGLEHVPKRHMWLHEFGSSLEVASVKSKFLAGDTLFGKLRPNFHKVVSAPSDGICSTDILVLRPIDKSLAGLVLVAAGSDQTVSEMVSMSAGTKMPRANWGDLSACRIRGVDDASTRQLSHRIMAVRDSVEVSIRESRTLAKLRDTLLPALMDGRLRVKDAIAQAEDVL